MRDGLVGFPAELEADTGTRVPAAKGVGGWRAIVRRVDLNAVEVLLVVLELSIALLGTGRVEGPRPVGRHPAGSADANATKGRSGGRGRHAPRRLSSDANQVATAGRGRQHGCIFVCILC